MKDIAAKENEQTRAEVQAAAAHKAVAKLAKETLKGDADRSKHAADLEAMKQAFTVYSPLMTFARWRGIVNQCCTWN